METETNLNEIKEELQTKLDELVERNSLDVVQVIKLLSMVTQDLSKQFAASITIIAK